VAQGVGPELKPQSAKKQKIWKKIKNLYICNMSTNFALTYYLCCKGGQNRRQGSACKPIPKDRLQANEMNLEVLRPEMILSIFDN
jgi:hypothetical protein